MPNITCSSPAIDCPGADLPLFGNISAEAPDAPKSFGYKFFPDQSTFCEDVDPEIAALCDPPPPSNPPVTIVYPSTPQTCFCPDTSISYTAPAGSAVGFSQSEADAAAYSFACMVAAILCSGGTPEIVQNTPQSCTVNCPDGSQSTFTVVANTFSALSQSEANALAFNFACLCAAISCANLPPLPPGAPPGGGAGEPPVPPIWFANSEQSCSSDCPDGGSFTFTTPSGLFTRTSLAAANSAASSYACQQALLRRVCLGSIGLSACVGSSYAQVISITPSQSAVWSLTSGTPPPGIAFENGILHGTPLVFGAYSFQVRATFTNGTYAERGYTIRVAEITTDSPLPDAPINVVYSQTLLQAGGVPLVQWTVVSGALPTGLSLNAATGEISGTPTVAGTYVFTVQMQDGF